MVGVIVPVTDDIKCTCLCKFPCLTRIVDNADFFIVAGNLGKVSMVGDIVKLLFAKLKQTPVSHVITENEMDISIELGKLFEHKWRNEITAVDKGFDPLRVTVLDSGLKVSYLIMGV